MPIKDNREYRDFVLKVEKRAEDDKEMRVDGYASTYDDPYLLWKGDGFQFFEVIDRGAFDNADMSDVIMQYNHEGRVFARTKNNTLEVSPDNKGLFMAANLGGTEIGRELYNEIRGGYTDKMSFAFTVNDEYKERTETDEGVVIYTRHVKSVEKVFDVSAVSIPANDATSISVRKLTDGVIEKLKAERLEEEKAELERQRVLTRIRVLSRR